MPNITIFLKVCPLFQQFRKQKIGRYTFGKQMFHFGKINVLLRNILIFPKWNICFYEGIPSIFLSKIGEM